jgi:hypothetical protein
MNTDTKKTKTMLANIDPTAGTTQDFARLTELQQQFNDTDNKLGALEVAMNEKSQAAAKPFAADYVVLQELKVAIDAEIKVLFAKHPEWRDGKSVKTPFGEVNQRTVTELELPNPAMTVALLKAEALHNPNFKLEDYLRISAEPNLEALESLSDEALAKLGVQRVRREQVTVKPAKMSVAKAVKAAKGKVTS